MARFLVRRIFEGLIVLWLVTVGVFLIFYIGPGPKGVARALAGKSATPQVVAAVSHRLLLDRPIWVQYGHFLWLLLHGNLGYSFYHDQSVNSILAAAFPDHPFAGPRRRHPVDRDRRAQRGGVRGAGPVLRRPRVYRPGPVLLLDAHLRARPAVPARVFYYELTIHGLALFPGSGYTPFTTNPFEWFRGLILPWFTLALVSAATYTRLTRGSMLDVMGEDYIRTARAKGLSERRVIFRHSLRAALTPIVTQFGLDVGHPARRRGHHRAGLRAAGPRVHRGAGRSPSRTFPSSSAWSSSPPPRSWWPTSWSTRSTPCSTRGSACTDLAPPAARPSRRPRPCPHRQPGPG